MIEIIGPIQGKITVIGNGVDVRKYGLPVDRMSLRSQLGAAAIMQLLSAPEEAQALAQAARRHVEMHYSARKQADEYLALYRRLLTQPASLH